MFLVCEAIAWGMEHVPFNASLLKTIRFAFPDEDVCFYGEETHIRYVREQVGEDFADSIIWQSLILPQRHLSFYKRLPSDFRTVNGLLRKIDEKPGNNVLVITGNPSILWALKYYIGIGHKNNKIQIIFHDELNTIPLGRSLRRTLDPFYRLGNMRTALKLSGYKHIQHIVLEDTVRDAVLKELPFMRDNLYVYDHPVPSDKTSLETVNFTPPIHFGFLGLITRHKGFDNYLKVASDISTQFPGLAKFNVIGRFPKNGSIYSTDSRLTFLNNNPLTERLSREEYTQRLSSLHFICLFYDSYYELCASGVLLDSIAWEKPIIATKLPIIENISSHYGDIGYYCRSEEISQTITSILKKMDAERYNKQVENIRRAKLSRTPESLARKYAQIVRES